MNYIPRTAPSGAPKCWAQPSVYDATDRECINCSYHYSCRSQLQMAGQAIQQPAYATPQPPQQMGWRSVAAPPQPMAWQQPAPPPPAQSMVRPPVPTAPTQIPFGGMQPIYDFAQVFGQYPGERTGERVGKNIILRMLEAAFNELTRFFHYWTWPNNPPDIRQ